MDFLPARLVDPVNRRLQRSVLGDLTRYGMPSATAGVVAQARATGVIPTIDVGLVAALRAGRVTPVGALDRFEAGEAVFADGARFAADAIILATGYSTNSCAPFIIEGKGIVGNVRSEEKEGGDSRPDQR